MQILPTSTIINLWRTVRRKCILILGLKGLRMVPPNIDAFSPRLWGNSRSYQGLLESRKKNVGNHAFFRDN